MNLRTQPNRNGAAGPVTIISHNHDLVFVHIPKCGGSSVEAGFQQHVRWGDYVIGSTREGEILHKQVFNTLYGITKHATAMEIRAALGARFARMRVAALVREPLQVVESYYRFSRSIHLWIASFVARHNPGITADAAKGRALDLVRAGKLDADPQFDVLGLLSGTIRTGVLAASFEQFLAEVGDARWSDCLSRYVVDDDGSMLATDILKLEEPETVESYFRAHLTQDFTLGHENASARIATPWPAGQRQRFHDLTAGEYARFGYRFQP